MNKSTMTLGGKGTTFTPDFKYKRKNSVFGLKFKLLSRTPQGALIGSENAIKRCATIVYEAFYKRGLIVKNVFFKEATLEFFIETEEDLISLNSLDKDWVKEYKKNWGKTFFTATVGQYVIYEDQYPAITNKVNELVESFADRSLEVSDVWHKNIN